MAKKEKQEAVVEAKTAKPAKKEKKQGKLKGSWRGFKSELKKVVWPSWKQVLKNTGIVIVIVLVCTIAIGALDLAFNEGFSALVGLFHKH